jgi:cobalt-zinc-cadmium resistance protein CzcA
MERIIAFALEQRFLVIIMTLVLVGVGGYCMLRLPIDAVPDVTNVQVQVNTNAPALGPLEVERQITFPIEVAMSGLPGVSEIRSLSKFGLSQVTVAFEDGTDIYFARQLVLERLQAAKEEIPASFGIPTMGPISTGMGEIYQYVVERKAAPDGATETADLTELRTIQDWIVKFQLRTIPGVTEVNSFGGFEKQYQVLVDPEKLLKHDLTLREVMQAVVQNNANAGGGYIAHGGEQYVVRGVGLVSSVEQVENVIVAAHEGTPIYVRDVAKVVIGPAIRQGAVTKDGRGEVVTGITMMLFGENSRVVANRVKERMAEVEKSLPPGVETKPFYDRTELVNRTIRTVEKNLIEGAIFVVVVLFLLLGNARAALIVALSIPLSMLFAFTLMVKYAIAGSLMSLGALDFGLIVDGSVVMVENSVRHLAERHGTRKSVLATVRDSCVEVARPIVFGVGIIIVVYLPLLTLEGIEGKMFRPMALTVVFALLGSLLLALTLTPALTALALRGKVAEKESFLIRGARALYAPVLAWALRERLVVVSLAGAALALAAGLVPRMGSEFIPRLDEGSIAIQVMRLPSVSLEESVEHTALVERAILANFPDEVETVVSKTGRAEIATDPMGVEVSDVLVMLRPAAGWKKVRTKEELVEGIDAMLRKIPGLVYSYSQPIELRVAELIAGVRSDVAIKIFGDDMDVLKENADRVAAIVGRVAGAADVKVEQVAGLPVLQVKVDQAKIARYGVNVADVLEVVETIGGKKAGIVLEGARRFDLVFKYPERVRRSREAIGSLLIATPDGGRIPLAQLASIDVVEGPAQISREQSKRRIVVELNVRGRDIGSFVEAAKAAIDREMTLPSGYWFNWGGQFENLERARLRLFIVVPLALFLIFVLLFTTFGSAKQALLVFSGVPFAAVGGVIALFLRGMPFSISAGVGFIALFGVAVLNGVVMVTYINQLKARGKSIAESVTEGAMTRLRPVLMTAFVASLGFVPMAIATTAGAEVQRPLATVVIGGLVTSTLLTLLVLPTLYAWLVKETEEVEP